MLIYDYNIKTSDARVVNFDPGRICFVSRIIEESVVVEKTPADWFIRRCYNLVFVFNDDIFNDNLCAIPIIGF